MLIRKIVLSCLAAVLAMSALAERADAYYSSAKGRFISRDPTGEGDGPNIYSFVRNRSVNRIDRLGLEIVTCINQAGEATEVFCDTSECEAYGWPIQTCIDNCCAGGSDESLKKPYGPQPAPTPMDTIEFWCFGVYGWEHCDIKCIDGVTGGIRTGGGTGPGAKHRAIFGINPDNAPGFISKPIPGYSQYAGSKSVPSGTCDCIWSKAQRLNAIKHKNYDMPPEVDGNYSNSNAATSLLLNCCDVSASPKSGSVLGWGHAVEYDCGCYVSYETIPSVTMSPTKIRSRKWQSKTCYVGCGDLE